MQISTVRIMVKAAALAAGALAPNIAAAQTENFVDLVFEGTVDYVRGDNISLRNPDGSTTNISSATLPDYLIAPGTQVRTTFRFDANDPAFTNSGCGGRVSLNLQGAGGPCSAATIVQTPFGNAGFGGTGGDARGSIIGLDVLRNPATGALSVDIPSGDYSLQYVGVNPYYYDSATQTVSSPNRNPCVNTFNCPAGIGNGNSGQLTFEIPVAGDFGTVQPGLNVGYDAGSAGLFSVIGEFFFGGASGGGSPGGPVSVPEPGMVLLFGGASLAIFRMRRRKRI